MAFFQTPELSIVDAPAAKTHRTVPLHKRQIRFIYLHATARAAPGNSALWLSTSSKPPVSCHRLIDRDGTIYKIVPDEWIAYTQGNGVMGVRSREHRNLNTDGLSIELENENRIRAPYDPYPSLQLRSLTLQVIEWWGLYGILPVLYHSDVDAAKHDPSGFPRDIFHGMLLGTLGYVLAAGRAKNDGGMAW